MINIEVIGENEKGLICQTDRMPCCRTPPNRAGEWYYPNGTRVLIEGAGSAIYRNRGDEGQVRLNRKNDAIDPTGLYRCEVPDARNIIRRIYVRLFKYLGKQCYLLI